MTHPAGLQALIDFFEGLPEDARRDNLVAFADGAAKIGPREGEAYAVEDVRKDEECTDTVGVYLKVDGEGRCQFRLALGARVQTLTRAMAAILCRGLEGCTPREVLDVPSDFVPRIVGAELVRIRSQTVYYVLGRVKGVCKVYLDRERARRGVD